MKGLKRASIKLRKKMTEDRKSSVEKKGINVLFVYPNTLLTNRIPISISILSACLKQEGHKTKVFDTTFFSCASTTDDNIREQTLQVKKSNLSDYGIVRSNLNLKTEFQKMVEKFKPKLIAVSCVENTYDLGISLLELAKQINGEIITVAGGVRITSFPDNVIKENCVDIVCIGEGEDALTELCNSIRDKKQITNIKNLWVKENGRVYKNPPRPLKDLNELPYPDWTIFDERHLYRPFDGVVYRTGSFALSRGCPFLCSFCVNEKLMDLSKGLGKYYREKNLDASIEEIKYFKDRYKLTMISLIDESFLLMKKERLRDFVVKYKEKINLPFHIQTRVDTISEDAVSLVKSVGCVGISLGVESGNPKIRKDLLNKKMSNDQIIEAFRIIKKYKIRVTSSNMIGLPYETRKNVFETIKLNRKINPDSATVSIFYPYLGTKLREISLKEGYIKENKKVFGLRVESVLDMPQFSSKEIKGLQKTFMMYLKMPKIYYPIIHMAEGRNGFSNFIYERLVKKFEKINEKK
jgi:anaerobic magnesium-protoporphyrin IX monomethyl ester cyclase